MYVAQKNRISASSNKVLRRSVRLSHITYQQAVYFINNNIVDASRY
jgi:hypothetical protein